MELKNNYIFFGSFFNYLNLKINMISNGAKE